MDTDNRSSRVAMTATVKAMAGSLALVRVHHSAVSAESSTQQLTGAQPASQLVPVMQEHTCRVQSGTAVQPSVDIQLVSMFQHNYAVQAFKLNVTHAAPHGIN